MIFIVLTFIAALAIEGLGTLVSVIGLSALFGSNPIIIALVVALDLGKLVSVSLLYTHWRDLPKLMKGYALIASTALMVITSAGAAGYLSAEFQRAIVGTQEGSLKVDVLKGQQAKYEERKKQIDAQIAALPEKTTVNQRLRLMNGFKQEQKELQDKISQIDKDLPALQVAQISTEAHAGPILYIAKAFNVSVEEAVKYVILLIIFVFDPLAIFLIIAGNFLLAKRRAGQVYGDIIHHDEDEPPGLEAELAKFDPVKHGGEFPSADVESNSQRLRGVDPINMAPTGSDEWNRQLEKYDPTIPLELDVDKFLEETHVESAPTVTVEDLKVEPTESDEAWWKEQEARSARLTAEAAERLAEELKQEEIQERITSMVIEPGDSLPQIESPEVLPEPTPAEEVPESIVEPPVEAPAPIKEPSRETITLSSLGLAPATPVHHVTSFGNVMADPHTVVDASQTNQVSQFQATPYPRPTKKLPAR